MGDMERMAATALCDKNDPTRLTWREVVIFERILDISILDGARFPQEVFLTPTPG